MHQKHDVEMIKATKRVEIEEELRLKVPTLSSLLPLCYGSMNGMTVAVILGMKEMLLSSWE